MQSLNILKQPANMALSEANAPEPKPVRRRDGLSWAEHRAELGRMVRRLFLAPSGVPSRVVVFAPVDAHVNTGRICIRAAEMLASQITGTVCIVDANLRDSQLHEHFHLQDACGLSDALREHASLDKLTTRIPGSNLAILPHGTPVDHCEELLNSDLMSKRLDELRSRFDFVIVNAPSIGLYPDPVLLGHFADGLVMVLEAEKTDRRHAIRAKAEVEAANVRLLGAVLNNRRFPIPEAIYRYL